MKTLIFALLLFLRTDANENIAFYPFPALFVYCPFSC